MIVAGLDIGNQTTEVALAEITPGSRPRFLAHAIVPTSGIKSTPSSIPGALAALDQACERAGISRAQIELVRINEAAPVIAGIAMQAITETTLTDSLLAGHNPETPGGIGLGAGRTVHMTELAGAVGAVIALVPSTCGFDEAANTIRSARNAGVAVRGAIVQNDDGVLIANRIGDPPIPIVDEVRAFERIPVGEAAAVEVAPRGGTIQTLCNPFGLATLFDLDPSTTARIAPAARALTGLRSAVVIRTPAADVRARTIPAGSLTAVGDRGERTVDLRSGAREVMKVIESAGRLQDVRAELGTTAGAMFGAIRAELMAATGASGESVRVRGLLAADLASRQPVKGGLSEEVAPERAVALAAMVDAGFDFTSPLAAKLAESLGVRVEAGGAEADAGIRGALTTPGTGRPFCVIDLGSGSTNAARIDETGQVAHIHLAGGGSLVDLMIGEELGIVDRGWREDVKRSSCARVETLYSVRHENGAVEFFPEPVAFDLFGRTVAIVDGQFRAIPGDPSVESVVAARRRAKTEVFGTNVMRALQALAPGGNPRLLGFVALIGGSALDFELPGLLANQLSEFGIVTGTANVRGSLGPRNAVATGLVLAAVEQ